MHKKISYKKKNKKKTMHTSFSHDEQDCKPENSSLAFAISEEPQRSLSPYIKAFDSSIMSWHMRYCMRKKLHLLVTYYKNSQKKKSTLKLKKPGFAKLKLLEDVPQKACKTNSSPFHSREPLCSRKFCIEVSMSMPRTRISKQLESKKTLNLDKWRQLIVITNKNKLRSKHQGSQSYLKGQIIH